MRLNAEIDGEKVALEVKREGGRVSAEVGGRRYELEARGVGAGEYLMIHGGRVYECRVGAEPGSEGRGAMRVLVGAREYGVRLTDPKHLRGAGAGGGEQGGRAQVKASKPGDASKCR